MGTWSEKTSSTSCPRHLLSESRRVRELFVHVGAIYFSQLRPQRLFKKLIDQDTHQLLFFFPVWHKEESLRSTSRVEGFGGGDYPQERPGYLL